MDRLLFNERGEADGLLLKDQMQVHLPPHLSQALQRKIKPGDEVVMRGVRPRGAPVLAAVSVSGPKGSVTDEGPTHPPQHPAPPPAKPVEVSGTVELSLFAPRGELCGALLDNGDILRLPPKENTDFAPWLQPGCQVTAWGDAIRVKGQRVIALTHLALGTAV
ncbi:hypothetical protein GT347_01790 [Xylophilus rhododendri]|uniref:Uncharacterized protein n=1 Tax=Xylophilus rhododendri TaxID=2697032 RepID=A0A857J169_9BURK|nr:hypothetical protein [Xylophilus rhododendri]QHI96831.1 hypothetical protein GT347_01790 [Xylophilus rhododendri]